jgi:hypothetical protein
MATILLVEDGPSVSREIPGLLEEAGHRVMRCGGGPTPLGACPLLRSGRCPLPDRRRSPHVRLHAGSAATLPLLPWYPPAARLPRPPRVRAAPASSRGRRASTGSGGIRADRGGEAVCGPGGGACRREPAVAALRVRLPGRKPRPALEVAAASASAGARQPAPASRLLSEDAVRLDRPTPASPPDTVGHRYGTDDPRPPG